MGRKIWDGTVEMVKHSTFWATGLGFLKILGGQKDDGSAVESPCSSRRGPQLSSQRLHGD